jgi:hypothetical protein
VRNRGAIECRVPGETEGMKEYGRTAT